MPQKRGSAQSPGQSFFDQASASAKDPKKALDLLSKCSPSEQKNDSWLMLQGKCYRMLREYDNAINAYKKMRNWQNRRRVLMSIAICYYDAGDYENQLLLLKQAIAPIAANDNDPNPNFSLDKALLALASCHKNRKEFDEAIKTLEKIKNWQQDIHTLSCMGHIFEDKYLHERNSQHRDDFLNQAIRYLEMAVKQEKSKYTVMSLGRSYQRARLFNKAIALYESLPNAKHDSDLQLAIQYCITHKNPHKALEGLQEELKKQPHDKKLLVALSHTLQTLHKYEEALECLFEVKDWETDNDTLLTMADCLNKMERNDEAIQVIEKVSGWRNNKRAVLRCIDCYADSENYADALQLAANFPRGDEDFEFLLIQAHIHVKMGKFAEARQFIYKIHPWETNRNALMKLGHSYSEENNPAAAIATFKKITDWQEDKKVVMSVAHAYKKMGDFTSAIATFKNCPNLTSDGELLQAFACMLSHLHRQAEAITYYKMMPNWENDIRASLGIGICLHQLGKLDEAEKILTSIPRWRKRPIVAAAISGIYAERGKFAEARSIAEAAPRARKNYHFIECIARSHGDTEKALNIYKSIPNWESERMILLSMACMCGRMERHADAIQLLKQIPHLENDIEALVSLSRMEYNLGNYQEAIKVVTSFKDWQTLTLPLLAAAHSLEALGELEEARQCYLKVPDRENNPKAQLSYARCLQKLGEFATALKILADLPDNETDPDILLVRGICLSANGDSHAALEVLTKIRDYEKNKHVLMALGRVYSELHQFAALDKCVQALKTFKMDKEIITNLAGYHIDKGEYDAALVLLKQSPDWENNIRILPAIVMCLDKKHNYAESIRLLTTTIHKNHPTILITLSICYSEAGKYSEATAAVKSIPGWIKNPKALHALARILQKQKEYGQAHNVLAKILDKHTSPAILITESSIYFEQGDYENAIRCVQKIQCWESDPRAVIALAYYYTKMQEIPNAIAVIIDYPAWQSNPRMCIAMASALVDSGRFDEAERILQEIDHWRENKDALMMLGHLYATQQLFGQAIATYKKIPDYQNQIDVSLALAMIHSQTQQSQAADDLLNNPAWASRPEYKKVLITKAHIHQKNGQYDQALLAYQQISGWENDPEVLLEVGNCYRQAEQFDDAIRCLKTIPGWTKDNEVLLALANSLADMGKYDDALMYFDQMSRLNISAKTSLYLCYAAKGDYQKALAKLRSIPGWETNTKVLISLAHLHEMFGYYEQGLNILKPLSIKNPGDVRILLSKAVFHENMGQTDEARACFEQLYTANPNKKLRLSYAFFLQKNGQYDTALSMLRGIENFAQNKQALLAVACCYDEMASYADSLTIYTKLLAHFPQYYQAHHRYCEHLFAQDDPNTGATIAATIKRWPFRIPTYLLQINHYYEMGATENAFNALQYLLLQFPNSHDVHLKMLRHYFIVGDAETGLKKAKEYKEKFAQNRKMQNAIDLIVIYRKLTRLFYSTRSDNSSDLALPAVPLPDHIQKLMKYYESVLSTDIYLCGKSVNDILDNKFDHLTDLDFVSMDVEINKLTNLGFRQDQHLPSLYTKHEEGVKIDLYVLTKDINKSVLSRDFTSSSLLVDSDKALYDPLEIGYVDHKKKRLRIIGNPVIRLRENPELLIRACAKEAEGCKPDLNFQQAMQAWEKPALFDPRHVYALTRKYLNRPYKEKFVQLLEKYGLLPKLFAMQATPMLPISSGALATLLSERQAAQPSYQLRLFSTPRQNDVQPTPAPQPAAAETQLPSTSNYGLTSLWGSITNYIAMSFWRKPPTPNDDPIKLEEPKTTWGNWWDL